ncbi:MAG: FliA/WhiG family RNA polymerase sigma factor [Bryobacteraceae bacterium]
MLAPGSQSYGHLGSDAGQDRENLILGHLPQVYSIARQVHNRLPASVSFDDVVSAGTIGLLAAVDNFDPSLNVQLRTYADRRIRGAIMDSLRDMDWAPRYTRKRARQIEAAIQNAKQRHGRDPSEEEIVTELQISAEEYHKWLLEMQSVELECLEFTSAEGQNSGPLQFLSDDEEKWPSKIAERADLERVLALALERMPKIERTVLSLYYYEELNLREISEIVNLHLSRVAQLRVQAILRLRSHFERVWLTPTTRKI